MHHASGERCRPIYCRRVSVCLSVCLCVCQKQVLYQKDWMDWASRLQRMLPSIYPMVCYKEFRLSPKVEIYFSGILFQTPGLENFATSIVFQQNGRACWSATTLTTVVAPWLDGLQGGLKKRGHRLMTTILPNLNRLKISLEDFLANLHLNRYLKTHRTLYMLLHYLVKH